MSVEEQYLLFGFLPFCRYAGGDSPFLRIIGIVRWTSVLRGVIGCQLPSSYEKMRDRLERISKTLIHLRSIFVYTYLFTHLSISFSLI